MFAAEPAPGPIPAESLVAGRKAFDKGDFENAAKQWEQAVQLSQQAHRSTTQVEAMVDLAAAYESLGQHRLALKTLNDASELALKINDRPSVLLAKSNLGVAYTFSHQPDLALTHLQESLNIAKADHNLAMEAHILNNLGDLFAMQHKYPEALDSFNRCVALARDQKNGLLAAKALANSASAALQSEKFQDADGLNDAAMQEAQALPPSHDQAFLLVRSGETCFQLAQHLAESKERLLNQAQEVYQKALQTAESVGDRRSASYALGYQGHLRESQGRLAEALELTRQAALDAQQVQSADALYRWEWQTGRLLKAQGQLEPAMAAYRRSIQTLQSICYDLSLGRGNQATGSSLRETVGPVFYEMADLLLQRADTVTDKRERQPILAEACETLEQLKSVELQDYFQDECASSVKARAQRLNRAIEGVAVVYLIPLRDRTELLLSLPGGLQRFKVPVTKEELTAEVGKFRHNLEKRTTHQYLEQSRRLYDWLIRPIQPALKAERIDTLVFVPDGALRTIPLAALQDGHDFLIKEYAVAMSPGLTLLEPHPVERRNANVLVGGLSQPVQGFATLDYVPAEVKNLQGLYRNDTLMDRNFVVPRLSDEFAQSQYSIVHIASHGKFGRDVQSTFILTYDGKLTLNELEGMIRPSQFRGKPVELLALSACQTAAGDEQAALGLAGVAVKAGARSALATLWFVNDQASTFLITEFYSQWNQSPSVSKARALQQAQLKMLGDRRYRHPCYWAPYLIIGNWL